MYDLNLPTLERGSAQILRFILTASFNDPAEDSLTTHPENFRIKSIKTMANRMVSELERSVLATPMKDEVYQSTQVPLTWKDHFKYHFWNRWWMPQRWLTEPRMRTIPTLLRRYRMCPHMKTDPDKDHIQFLFERKA